MIKPTIFALFMMSSVILCGQTLNMTFTASGASDKVDSVKATNLRTNESVIMNGNDTLVLNVNTGIFTITDASRDGIVYPNPFSGMATFKANILKDQTVKVEIYTLLGQLVAHTEVPVVAGYRAFTLSLSQTGIYLVSLTTCEGTSGYKVICTGTSGDGDWIRYTGNSDSKEMAPSRPSTIYNLAYKTGDILLYRCRGGIFTTIITDSPTSSKTYTVEFALCKDPDGKNYAIVKIGAQTWMAENLAWLPSVTPSAKGSDSLKYYYVAGYEDSLVSAAKNTYNYKRFGVLYNWLAAMDITINGSSAPEGTRGACPAGWHMPTDEEWKTLETTLGMSQHDADSIYLRTSGEAGKKLKSSVAWENDTNSSNFSGFTALAGGYRNTHGGFPSLGSYALFWTATPLNDTVAWYRSIYDLNTGIYRFTTMKNPGFSVRCIKDPL